MKRILVANDSRGLRSGVIGRLAALALCVTLAMALRAAEERAVKTRIPPIYPEIAKRMKITGVVVVEAIVNADGKVIDVKAVSGPHALAQAAMDAVQKWKFVPAAAVSTVDVEINFALAE
jgi:TonB family protein